MTLLEIYNGLDEYSKGNLRGCPAFIELEKRAKEADEFIKAVEVIQKFAYPDEPAKVSKWRERLEEMKREQSKFK